MEIQKEMGSMEAYEDFEPFCKWQREQGRDILQVHLEGFKKDQLRVQINSHGILTISGQQPTGDGKTKRFRREISVCKDLKPTQIRAKFAGGILYVTMLSGISDSNETTKKERDDKNSASVCETLRSRMAKNMAVCVALSLAAGLVVGGFIVAWKCSKLPPPIRY